MPLDPNILLSTKPLGLGEILANAQKDKAALETRGLQNQILRQNISSEEQKAKAKAGVEFNMSLLPDLYEGNYDAVELSLDKKIAELAVAGEDVSKMQQAKKILKTDPSKFQSTLLQANQRARQFGVVPDLPKGKTNAYTVDGRRVAGIELESGQVVDPDAYSKGVYRPLKGAIPEPKGSLVTIDNSKGIEKGQEELAKSDAKTFGERRNKADLSQQQLTQIAQIRAGAEGFRTGAGGNVRMLAAQIIDFLGEDPGKYQALIGGEAHSAEAVAAAANTLTTQFVREYDDRINKDELALIKARGPTLLTTGEGINILADIMERQANKDIAIADFQDNWLAKTGGRFRVSKEESIRLGLGAVSVDGAIRKIQKTGATDELKRISPDVDLIAEPVINQDIKDRLRSEKTPTEVKAQSIKAPQTTSAGVKILPIPEGMEPPKLTEETKNMKWIAVTEDGKYVLTDGVGLFEQ